MAESYLRIATYIWEGEHSERYINVAPMATVLTDYPGLPEYLKVADIL